jgi:hypothetical protein
MCDFEGSSVNLSAFKIYGATARGHLMISTWGHMMSDLNISIQNCPCVFSSFIGSRGAQQISLIWSSFGAIYTGPFLNSSLLFFFRK